MRPAALIPALLFALASASNITNNTTSNATNTRYCKCENVDDTNSVADYKLCLLYTSPSPRDRG